MALAVYITEDHNNVVPFIHRAIASKKLPFTNIPMVHLDSHPDLLIPPNLTADNVFEPHNLYDSVSIENWLLPQVFAKHVNPVVWVKPPWAKQIQASDQRFLIGKCQRSGTIRVTSQENYFLTDGLYRHKDDLSNTTEVHLLVVELRPDKWDQLDPSYVPEKSTTLKASKEFSDYSQWTFHVQDELKDKAYILDIDLDFFSTQNPFKDMLSAGAEEAVRRLYNFPDLENLSEEAICTVMTEREKQLSLLEKVWTCADKIHMENKEKGISTDLEGVMLPEILRINGDNVEQLSEKQQSDIGEVLREVLKSKEEKTFSQVHDFGCTLDDTELPHHVSTQQQVDALGAAFSQVLEHIPKPAIVTIARSSIDEYCPLSQVDQIERMVLQLLEKHYGKLSITKDID